MIEILVTSLFALGCFLVVVGLPWKSAGSTIRRIGATLILIPLAACIFFGSLKETLHQQGIVVGIDAGTILGVIVLSVIAYAILKLRQGKSTPHQQKRIAMKRPYSHQRRDGDVISFIREQLNRDE